MSTRTLPPFELEQYRLIYLEATNSITSITVKGDPAFGQSKELAKHLQVSWELHSVQVTDILLRIVLHTERASSKAEIPPSQFLLRGKGYTLMVEQKPWRIGERYLFQQETSNPPPRVELAPELGSKSEGDGASELEEVRSWPWKYVVTYCPEQMDVV